MGMGQVVFFLGTDRYTYKHICMPVPVRMYNTQIMSRQFAKGGMRGPQLALQRESPPLQFPAMYPFGFRGCSSNSDHSVV